MTRSIITINTRPEVPGPGEQTMTPSVSPSPASHSPPLKCNRLLWRTEWTNGHGMLQSITFFPEKMLLTTLKFIIKVEKFRHFSFWPSWANKPTRTFAIRYCFQYILCCCDKKREESNICSLFETSFDVSFIQKRYAFKINIKTLSRL